MMRISVVIGIIAIVLCAALVYIAHNAKRIPAPPGSGITVNVGGVIAVKPHAYVCVESNGRTVYLDEMNSLTEYGSWWLSNVLTRFVDDYDFSIRSPFTMRVYHTGGYMDSSISKTWGANSTHMWFIITGTFVPDAPVRLTHVTLWWDHYAYDGSFTVRNLTVDVLPNIYVAEPFTVSIIIVWYDRGAFLWNWPIVLHTTIVESQNVESYVYNTYGWQTVIAFRTWYGHWSPIYDWKRNRVRLFAAFTNATGSHSRDDYMIPNSVQLYPVSVASSQRGVAISVTVPYPCYEIAIVMEYTIVTEYFSFYHDRTVILRWRSPSVIPVGTSIIFYIFPGG